MAVGDDDTQWFREVNPGFWPGQAFSLEIDKVLYKQRSKYQDILVFKRYIIASLCH
jgi:spermidine synthase